MGSSRRLTTWLLLWMLLLPADTAIALAGPRAPAPHADVEMLAADAGGAAPACDVPGVNTVFCENQRPGVGPEEWDLPGHDAGDPSIQGFATDISVNLGETIQFKIDSTTPEYRIEIFRLGYYQGLGARRIGTVMPTPGVAHEQPNCLSEPLSGLIDCGNWRVSASWTVPALAVSGVYLAKLVQTLTGAASHIVFIVRDDTGGSDLLFQTSDTTWQAYNDYAGNSLYRGVPAGRAYKVSYNRPLVTRGDPGAGRATALFNAEYPMIRWLEANGYDVSYASGVDTDRRGAELLEHKVFLSVGHDEYWSGRQRASVEAARDAGVHLAFFSGNAVFWKTRWETSIDTSGAPYRTLVCYKETHANAKIDPSAEWTGTWRDPRFSPPADGGRPENVLTGTLFRVNGTRADSIKVPAAFGRHRFWRNTSLAVLQSGQTAVLPAGTLGYEWDEAPEDSFRPLGLQRLSSTTLDVSPLYLQDYGNTYGPGTATHSLTLYRAPSGALVFSSGTVQWSWGLDSHHDRGAEPPSPDMQQATVNLLADMGVHSDALQPGLMSGADVADLSAPVSAITAPPSGAVVRSGDPIVISGTASDDRALAGIDVSVNGGTTWMRATGLANWTLNWTPGASGPVTIQSRAFDDSGNMQATPASVTITVARDCPCSIWDASAVPPVPANDDPNATEVGVRFRAEIDGLLTGIRFYKGPGNDGTHTGSLWTPTGTLLASAVFTNETATGWQQVDFATPVQVTANATYIASYHAPLGRYAIARPSASAPLGGFAQAVNNPPLRALADNEDGSNGVFVYSSSPAFPTQSFGSTNYFVDVVFVPTVSADEGAPFVTERTPLNGATGVTTFTDVTARFNRALDPASVTSGNVELRGPAGVVAGTIAYLPATRTIVLDPTLALDENTTYIVTLRGGPTGIRDLSGVPLDLDVSWTFTTAAPVVCPCTIWPETAVPVQVIDNIDDTLAVQQGIELGVRFRADHDGVITGIRFYKSEANVGPHAGTLWTSAGTELATATLTGDTSSGWQQMTFASPVRIVADQTYVASYHAPAGRYSVDAGYFTSAASANFTRPPLRALVDGVDGLNGVFRYGPRAFPIESFNQSNYWVDVVFEPAPENSAPVASADSYATQEGGVLTVAPPGVLVNDTDAQATALTAVLVSGPVNGTLSLDAGGSFTYTPNASFSGTDSFVYVASDGLLDSSPAVVAISVEAVNHAPVASSRSLSTLEDTAVPLVLAGVDSDGDPVTFTIATPPSNGTLSGTAPNLTYTPAANYSGSDSFTFTVNDGAADSNLATVSIAVTAVNDAPVAADQAVVTAEDTPVAITLGATDADGSSFSYAIVSSPVHGTLSGTAPNLTYTPAADYSGSDTVTFTVNDGAAGSNVATVTLTVNPINDVPVAGADARSTGEDTPLVFLAAQLTSNDTDPDGDPLAVTAVTGATKGTVVLTAGSITYTPNINVNGSDTFTYTVTDGKGGTATGTVNVAIAAVNDAPITVADMKSTTEDTPLVLPAAELTSNDTDPDGDTLIVTAVTGATKGTVVLTAGSITYTPNINVVGSDAFTYTVTDGKGGTATGTVNVVIAAANDAPAAVNDSATTTEDSAVDVLVIANDTDTDSANTALRVQAGSIANVRGGTAALLIDGRTVRFTPALNANDGNTTGGFGFTYRVSDGALLSANEGVVTITVAVANDAPAAVSDSYAVDEDLALGVPAPGVLANDTDVDGDPRRAVLIGVPLPAQGSLSLAADGSFTFVPALNFHGTATFSYRASDGTASSNPVLVTITVRPVNDAPVAENNSYSVAAGGTLTIGAPGLLGNDRDVDGTPTTAAALESTVAHGTLTLRTDGSFDYTPEPTFTGVDSFSYRASDGVLNSAPAVVAIAVGGDAATKALPEGGASTSTTVSTEDAVAGTTPQDPVSTTVTAPPGMIGTVTIAEAPLDPAVIAPANYSSVGQQMTISAPEATAANPLVLRFRIDGSLLGSIDRNTVRMVRNGSLVADCTVAGGTVADPDPCESGRRNIANVDPLAPADLEITILTSRASIWYPVANTAPVARDDSYSVAEDGTLTVAAADGVLRTDIDREATQLTPVLVTGPVNGTFALSSDGSFTYAPPANFHGSVSFRYYATDGLTQSNTATATITVTPVNDAPVALDDAYSVDEDQTLTVMAPGVLGNDTDVDRDALTTALVSGPTVAQGVLNLPASGGFTFTPASNFNGTVTFTYRASDSSAQSNLASVTITVKPVNDDPTISAIANQDLTVGTASAPVPFTIGDVETAADALILSASSSNTAVVPFANITFGGSGANRTVTVIPASAGPANITVTVRDAANASASRTFVVTAAASAVATTTTLSSPTASPTTYGQAVVLNASVARAAGTPTGPVPTGSVDFLDNAELLGNVSLVNGAASLSTTSIGGGTRTITAVYKPAAGFGDSEATITRTVNKATATGSFVTLTPLQKQYSDRVLMEATVSPVTAAESVTFRIGTQVLDTVPIVNGRATANPQMLVNSGSKLVTAVFNSANYTVSNVTKSMSVLKEDARVAYAGPKPDTLCLCGKASVAITVNVSDISVTSATDHDPGDIGTATVSFVNRSTLATYGTVTVTPNLDRKTGTATFNFPASALGTATSQTITFGFQVNGNYMRNSTAEDVTITITK